MSCKSNASSVIKYNRKFTDWASVLSIQFGSGFELGFMRNTGLYRVLETAFNSIIAGPTRDIVEMWRPTYSLAQKEAHVDKNDIVCLSLATHGSF